MPQDAVFEETPMMQEAEKRRPSNEVSAAGKEKQVTWGAFGYQVILVGAGFMADAYDLFVIDLVISILHRLHPEGMDPTDKSLVAGATLAGAIIGQLVFGLFGDWIGRKWTFIATCVLIIFGAVLSGCVQWEGGPCSLICQLAICRFFLGIGVGGEYPLAASIAAEDASTKSRGQFIAGVFSMQGWGMLLSCVFVLLFLAAGMPLEYIWRSVLIIGAIPSAVVIFMRAEMEESDIFRREKLKRAAACADESLLSHMKRAAAVIRKYWHPMVGTTMTWLLLDITFYGTGSFKSRIAGTIVDHGAEGMREQIWHEAVFATICVCMAIPGYLLSVAFIDKLGRYNIQFWGFVALTINFFVIAYLSRLELTPNQQWWLLMCFGLTFLFSNFGPNTTTFVIPVEVYPTVVRATCHGISAAAGKLGAVIGVVAFSPCEAAFGLPVVLAICGCVCATGATFTFFFTSDKVVDLEVMDEDYPVKEQAVVA